MLDTVIYRVHFYDCSLTVGLSEIMPFPGDVSSMAENAKGNIVD